MKKNKVYYGIWDAVTCRGLSKWEDNIWEWDATLEEGGFELFESFTGAVIVANELTKAFRSKRHNAEIEWDIVEIKQIIKESIVPVKTIKEPNLKNLTKEEKTKIWNNKFGDKIQEAYKLAATNKSIEKFNFPLNDVDFGDWLGYKFSEIILSKFKFNQE